jgi:hypothetical protein
MTPDFRKLWLGRSVSFVGSEITGVALPLAAVLLLEADASEMGWLVAAQNLPWLFFGLAAGVWIDRARRKPIVVATHFGATASLAAIPAAAYFGQLNMLILAAAAFGASSMAVLGNVADRAYLPALVGRERLRDDLCRSSRRAARGGPPCSANRGSRSAHTARTRSGVSAAPEARRDVPTIHVKSSTALCERRRARQRSAVGGRAPLPQLRSKASTSLAATGLPKRYPCRTSHFKSRNRFACSSDSTPSATTVSSKA